MNTMPISELIEQVTEICKKNGVKRLDLFGSFGVWMQQSYKIGNRFRTD